MDTGWESDHIWLYLLALGFSPNDEVPDGSDDLELETTFVTGSISELYVIASFLFAKLDKSRAEETFRDSSCGQSSVTNTDFRKKCCMWLKDIAKENESFAVRMAPSSFVSTGYKTICQLYWFARHVLVEDMKTNSVGTDIPVAEAGKLRPRDMYMASARYRVAYNKLLQIFQKEDFIIQEYNKKAQLLIQEINQIKSENAALQIKCCQMEQNDQTKKDKTERIQKVRSMWTLIMEILTSLKKEKEFVDSVLEDCVDQCILDGTNVVFSVPSLLAHRVENDTHELCAGNVYEAEKLNLLAVIQLLNEALRTLRDEHHQSELKQQPQFIEDKVTICKKLLQSLEAKSQGIEQQHCVSMSGSVSEKQDDWKAKWKSFLGVCPINLILDQNTELGLKASPPHSFDLEENDDVFCQHITSVSDVFGSIHEVCCEKDDGKLETMVYKSTSPPRRSSSVPLELSKASENRDVLIEKNFHTETCKGEETPVPSKVLKNGKNESTISEVWENAGDDVIQTESPVKKEDPLKKARDELAEEVARTVMSKSPESHEGEGMALEDLISSLAFNPFLTRKQIPRTPENLLTEIRSSWRKAVQTEGSLDIELAPAEVKIEEAPMEAGCIMQKAADSRSTCSIPVSPVPDFDPPLSERKSQLSSTEFRPQEQLRRSHVVESPDSETSGIQKREQTEAQELKCVVLNKSSVEDPEEQTFQYVKKSMNTSAVFSEDNSRTSVLPSDHFQGSLVDEMLDRNELLSSISPKDACWGILDETFPEELDNINPGESTNVESDFDITNSTYLPNSLLDEGAVQKSKLDLQSLFNTYKALKKTASSSEEELHQTHNGGGSISCRSDLSLEPEKREKDELCSPSEHFCLDEEFTKTPSPKSLNESKYSLSSLLVSYQDLEEMASMVHKIPLDLIHKLKDKEQLNEKLGTKEPSSG
ncbi:HAUS augmin-like complex subunit 6 isoform 2-T2 [Cariama cristata]